MKRSSIVTAICFVPLLSLGAYGKVDSPVKAEASSPDQLKIVKDPNNKGVRRIYNPAGEEVGIQIINNAEAIRAEEAKEIEEHLTNDNTDDDNFYLMVQGFGGFSEYYEFLHQASPGQIEALHMGYGVGELEYGDKSSAAPTDGNNPAAPAKSVEATQSAKSAEVTPNVLYNCPTVWASQWRNRRYQVGSTLLRTNMYISVDGFGRSGQAGIALFPRGTGRVPHPDCSRVVRATGVAGDDAGHLIARILGGGSYRANFIAQNRNLNRGIWRSHIEDTARKCANKLRILGYYNVRPIYDLGGLRPYRLRATMFAFNVTNNKIQRMQRSDFINRSPDSHARGLAKVWRDLFDICK